MTSEWPQQAKCQGSNDALFAQGAEQRRAKQVCLGCPVRPECLAEALDNRIEWGVWGGLTERERRRLLRRHDAVPSWREALRNPAGLGDPALRGFPLPIVSA